MGKMKDALAKLTLKVTGKEVEDSNSISNIIEEMEKGFDVPTNEEVDEKIGEQLTSVYKYKGSVATYDNLPTSGRKSGDVYNVADTGKNYAYNGSGWDDLGGSAKLVVEDITALTSAQVEGLNCGDAVVKLTGNQQHCYIVTYKEREVGMCLTYVDASVVETQSYDYVDGNWVYNSEDKTSLELKPATASRLGGIKVGNNLSIDADGTLNASGGGGSRANYTYVIELTATVELFKGTQSLGNYDITLSALFLSPDDYGNTSNEIIQSMRTNYWESDLKLYNATAYNLTTDAGYSFIGNILFSLSPDSIDITGKLYDETEATHMKSVYGSIASAMTFTINKS